MGIIVYNVFRNFPYLGNKSRGDLFMERFKLKHGFTLAEVLITLGVIGVVAALTIPTVIANYQKKVTGTRLKQTYSQLLQAIQLSEAQNGYMTEWNHNLSNNAKVNTKLFVEEYIIPYFSNIQYCSEGSSSKCGATISGSGQNYFLSNGVSLSFVQFPTRTYFSIIIDINGAKKPGLMGRDVFMFNTSTGSLKPQYWFDGIKREDMLNGISLTTTEAGQSTTNTVECKANKTNNNDPNELNRHGCTALLMLDNWEIKDDYPW